METRIIINPKILAGKPVIKGTRLSVEFLLELLSSGMTITEICKEYPPLTSTDVLAALAYASRLLRQTEVYTPAEAA